MQIPCFEDSQQITKAMNLTQLISFVWEVCNISLFCETQVKKVEYYDKLGFHQKIKIWSMI